MSTARPSNLPPPGGPPRASDVRRRTVAPTTLQNLIAAAATKTYSELPSEEYLDKMEEELNRKVDLETEVLVEGMAEMVKISQVRLRPSFPSSLRVRLLSGGSEGAVYTTMGGRAEEHRAATIFLPLRLQLTTLLPQIEGKDHFRVSQDAFQASCRTESMVRPPPSPSRRGPANENDFKKDPRGPLSPFPLPHPQAPPPLFRLCDSHGRAGTTLVRARS